MRLVLVIAIAAVSSPVQAGSPCEIKGLAIHWAYDSCMSRYETDDGLHPGVIACADRAQRLIRVKGECTAKRIFKDRICALLQRNESPSESRQACMRDPGVVGMTVRNNGL